MSKIGLIGAMDEEVAVIKEWMTDIQQESVAGCEFFVGKLDGVDVVLQKSGIGKVNAALSTTLLLNNYAPDKVINIGSAGGFGPDLEVGDVVISSDVVHHDVDVTVFGYELGQVPNLPATYEADAQLKTCAVNAVETLGKVKAKIGLIGSGDVFMCEAGRVAQAREAFPTMIAVEMEAAAVAQVCYKFETPFVVVRSLSDVADKESPASFEEYLKVAAENSSRMIREMIKEL
ncbi:5'-methylthioadenosine/S-adenosylhomocysteine nucleosidase [Marinomonas mediterranea]|uniref:5'-methylthioadenosine/S-adenosylhomocysteine nucleosidase n=1 Tax=Marinomonas mediterranea (strain ATCC 700492 / JCM 21426 / NBRC 103028 / MMB-1) TaxID=717774 RepID=F2JZD2_MARM1|nr:5'-methylthioadenosine/S-adenosylhomocysteine nucleosidase [Marinomonas mediterranea]ADZ93217.1 5'-methylthioadenosine/S-adenosylhomocysteine nucleosidase [Marinomonas mediterranea MMB-1]WCN19213.1 5'-methylthioadenosine/S-adenosylhomocysteine nucleosidase [Marinomonas mediterranea MMB-1]